MRQPTAIHGAGDQLEAAARLFADHDMTDLQRTRMAHMLLIVACDLRVYSQQTQFDASRTQPTLRTLEVAAAQALSTGGTDARVVKTPTHPRLPMLTSLAHAAAADDNTRRRAAQWHRRLGQQVGAPAHFRPWTEHARLDLVRCSPGHRCHTELVQATPDHEAFRSAIDTARAAERVRPGSSRAEAIEAYLRSAQAWEKAAKLATDHLAKLAADESRDGRRGSELRTLATQAQLNKAKLAAATEWKALAISAIVNAMSLWLLAGDFGRSALALAHLIDGLRQLAEKDERDKTRLHVLDGLAAEMCAMRGPTEAERAQA